MSSSISAGTTSGTAIVVSGDTSGSLVLQTNGTTTAVTVSTGQVVTLAQPLPVASGGTGVTTAIDYGFKNRIINGGMVVDQRNAGASVTPTNAQYTLDRWKSSVTAASKFTVQQTPSATETGYATRVAAGFTNYLGVTSSSSYSVGSGDAFGVYQQIEGYNISDLAWGTASAKTVTLSFQVYSSLTGTFSGVLQNSAGNRSYPFTYTVSLANTWTAISVTITGDTSGTWLTTNGIGTWVYFNLGVGSTYVATAGAWASGAYYGVTGSVSIVGTSGATFYITGVQFEKGSTATSFDYRPYGTELALCQRYYEKSYNLDVVPATATVDGSIGTFPAAYSVYFPYSYKVSKRVSPTVTGYSPFNGATGNYAVNNSSNVALSGIFVNGQSGFCAYTGSTPGNVSATLHFTSSAEL